MFEDPRPGNIMNLLPEKDKTKVTYASSQINYKVKPGRMIFFPSCNNDTSTEITS